MSLTVVRDYGEWDIGLERPERMKRTVLVRDQSLLPQGEREVLICPLS